MLLLMFTAVETTVYSRLQNMTHQGACNASKILLLTKMLIIGLEIGHVYSVYSAINIYNFEKGTGMITRLSVVMYLEQLAALTVISNYQ